MKAFKYLFIFLLVLIGLYLIGPVPNYGSINLSYQKIECGLPQLDSLIKINEQKFKDLKPENEAKIVWNKGEVKETEFAILYLHGFTASYMEGNPINVEFAARYGCNLYLSRLEQHGRMDTNAFEDFTPENYFESAQRALEITKKIGKKVIVMSCSTGSTLAILLAKTNPEIHSFIMFSPNIDIKDPLSSLTINHWGRELTELVIGDEYNHAVYPDEAKKYWYTTYHINGIIALKKFIVDNMIEENFKLINQPLFMAYYYKNKDEQDDVVSVQRMLDFYSQVSTPEDLKFNVPLANANTHIISSSIFNKNIIDLQKEVYKFAEEVLMLKKNL